MKRTKTALQEALGLKILVLAILILPLFLSITSAITQLEAHNKPFNNAPLAGVSAKSGARIWSYIDQTLTKITKNETCTATTAYLLDAGKNVIASAPFVGDDATFSQGIVAGTVYYLTVNSSTTYTMPYASGFTFNVTGVNINWTGGLSSTGTDTSTSLASILSATFEWTGGLSNPSVFVYPTNILFGSLDQNYTLNYSINNGTTCYYNYDYGRWSFESNKSEGWVLDRGTVCNRSATCNPTLGNFGVYAVLGGNVMNKTFYNLRNISFQINGSTSVHSGRLYLDINGVNVNSTDADGTLSYSNPSNGTALVTIRTPSFTTGIQPSFDGTIDNILINGQNGTSTSCVANSSFLMTPNNAITLYAQDSLGKVESNTTSWDYVLFMNSKSYNPQSTSGSTEPFSVNLTYDTSYPILNVILSYNNTNFTATTSDTGSNRKYSIDVIAPLVSSQTNKSAYWQFDVIGFSQSYYFTSPSFNQSVNLFSMDNCSSNGNYLLNFTMFDQDSRVAINGTIEFTAKIYSVGADELIRTYNSTYNYRVGTQSAVCISNISSSYKLAYIIKFYGNTTYFQQYKTIQSLIISNSTIPQQIKLYNLQTTSGFPFTISVRGSSLTNNEDILVDAQRQYVGLDSFQSVESSVTDSSGNTVIHLVQGSVVYNFVVSYYGQILGTFNNNQVLCTNQLTGDCDVILNLATANAGIIDLENYGNVSFVYLLNNNRTLFTTFSTTDGTSRNIRQIVIKNDGFGNSTICSNSMIGTSGTFVCAIPIVYGNTTFISKMFSNDEFIGSTIFNLGESGTSIFYAVRTFLMMLLYTTLVLVMLSNPVLIVLGAILGILIGTSLLLIDGGTSVSVLSAIIYFILLGAIIIWQITKRI